ncbi:integrase arm-type DNA-binding domain-containing protein [Bradyrhizobium diazoefficiens]|nr:integrase arm-type DNA-binding domain-containing protein [Bradyrhizobium diazoefficiens]MBR0982252.1 integrase arm-type DNA-binding domain-containing protein [Bradyrhizobium diazoefficiens]MBR1011688.1 integrase arm-type DNA-binding domain-containing protein [Bradyrhizobium diazoefficiens]MBR1018164.1 integrase arm-type DNA-binding domain-containing protein [Bradyrhizobium diazoefficiens]MBR1057451.1 integrase arm-type DNA-binding domain-containing protein [Bradyrhizobium diazoefficiens]MBR
MRKPLSAKAIANAEPKAKRYALPDVGHPGLRVLVQPSGAKSFVYRFKRENGQDVTITLGPAEGPGALTLAQAREAAGDARRQRALGSDPADQRRATRRAEAARIAAEEKEARRKDDIVERVLDRYYRDKVNAMKSAKELKRLLSKELTPWAKRRVDDIARADAIKLVDAIKEKGRPVLANRTRAAARTFFGWCIDKALIEDNPFERTKPVAVEKARERALSDGDLRVLSLALDRMDWIWRAFYWLLVLTGQRRDEVADMAWAELKDLDGPAPLWVLPAKRTKNGREHVIPLSPAVVEILRAIPRVQVRATFKGAERLEDSPLVLTTTGTTPISGFSKAKVHLDKALMEVAREEAEKSGDDPVIIEPWRIHDLRRTMVSGMASLGVSVAVVEKVVNHVSGTFGGIVGVYQRHDYLAEKRHALNLWADHVASLTVERPSNVVSIKAGA